MGGRSEVLKSHPQLSPESLQACFAYASEVIAEYRSVQHRRDS